MIININEKSIDTSKFTDGALIALEMFGSFSAYKTVTTITDIVAEVSSNRITKVVTKLGGKVLGLTIAAIAGKAIDKHFIGGEAYDRICNNIRNINQKLNDDIQEEKSNG